MTPLVANDLSRSFPSGQVMSLRTVLEQRADFDRIVIAIKKLTEKRSTIGEESVREIENRFLRDLYMQAMTPVRWYREARIIVEDVLSSSFEEVASSRVRDLLYLDPPYPDRTEIYSGKFDHGELWKWMEQQRGSYLLSLNGFVDGEDRRLAVPGDLFDEEFQIDAGISSLNTNGAQHVTNSLYVRMRKNGGR